MVQAVQKFGDVELIASYLFVVWSEWDGLPSWDCGVMLHLIRGELSGVGVGGHQEDLIHQLDRVLPRLRPGSHKKRHYEEFRTALLEMNKEAAKTLTGMSHRVVALFCLLTCACAGYQSTFMCTLPPPCP